MSSPTVLFILDRLRRRKAARPYVALGFGPGLTAEAALIQGTSLRVFRPTAAHFSFLLSGG
jgi:predicted naringenin-chalcone synthase